MSRTRLSKELMMEMQLAIAEFDTPQRRDQYRRREIARADTVRDINMRYRWDLLYMVPGAWKRFGLSAYTDSHIDTALRMIVKPL